ncbi:hypothetical protein EWM64_g9025 [Hericium alpestre]|uniref:HMG box domain-containing protein n=1 Tax=Hericium alpestre TaxID=135208 RepID=A0A4Y9ZLL3_9AGAM|nr:hypothetical protein EWM64_g9025 [Hericium alpestre]
MHSFRPRHPSALKDQSPLMSHDDHHFPHDPLSFDSDQMIFGPLDIEDGHRRESSLPFAWDIPRGVPSPSSVPSFSASPASACSQLDFGASSPSSDPNLSPSYNGYMDMPALSDYDDGNVYLSNWLVDDFGSLGTSAPIAIPSVEGDARMPTSFASYEDNPMMDGKVGPFSPSLEYAALHPLPRSTDEGMSAPVMSVSPPEISQPSWASQLWNQAPRPTTSPQPSLLHPPSMEDAFATQRPQRRRPAPTPLSNVFQSSSAPSGIQSRAPSMARSYSRRAESVSINDDRDATVRRKRKAEDPDDLSERPRLSETPPQKSHLRPPKLAPSAWQLYFTDWIQRHQATSTRKLNVAQAAKEAGSEYAQLSPEEKEPYKRRSQAMKEIREREHAAYMSSLTPDDIKRENNFRAAQRKAGKSRKGNIKDPNAPKKPLSAYFMFLQRIRSDPVLVREVFGDETETTKQSVLAAGKWRSMTDDERKPFLAQAEQEKLEYETARKLYEEGTPAYGTSISFSVLPSNSFETAHIPLRSRSVKSEPLSSEDESESSYSR